MQLTCIAFWSADELQRSSKCAELQEFWPGLFTLTLTFTFSSSVWAKIPFSRYSNLVDVEFHIKQTAIDNATIILLFRVLSEFLETYQNRCWNFEKLSFSWPESTSDISSGQVRIQKIAYKNIPSHSIWNPFLYFTC